MTTTTSLKSSHAQERDDPASRMQRQREFLETVRHSNEILRLDLTREVRDSRELAGAGSTAEISRLQKEADRYKAKIEVKRTEVAALENEILSVQESIVQQKSQMGGINAAAINNAATKRQIQIIKHRVDKVLTKLNETIASNRVLRTRVEEYRKERLIYDAIYKTIERDLHEKRREMEAIIDESRMSFLQRDKSQSEMRALQAHTEKERRSVEARLKELEADIKKLRYEVEMERLKQFERAPNTTLTGGGLVTINPTSTRQREAEFAMESKFHAQDGSRSMHKTGTGNVTGPLSAGGSNASVNGSTEKLNVWEEAMIAIMERMGVTDVEDVVNSYLEAEEKNFSSFNYVSDLNSEIERLEHSIASMQSEIERQKGRELSSDSQRKKIIRELEDRVRRVDNDIKRSDEEYAKEAANVGELKLGIQSIFARLGSSSPLEELFGNQGVTESNLMHYLSVIEARTTDILLAYAASQRGVSVESLMKDPRVEPAADPVRVSAVTVPSAEEVSSDESDGGFEERPLTRSELSEIAKLELRSKQGLLSGQDDA